MARLSINARKVFVVQKHTSSSLGNFGELVKGRIVGTGNSEFVDLSYGVIKNDPNTGRVLKESLAPFVDEANSTISRAFSTISDYLSSPEELPTASRSGGARRIYLGFANFTTSPWPGLSKSYDRQIKRGIFTKRRNKDKKVFWYERGHWKRPPVNSNRGGSSKPLHQLLRDRGFSKHTLTTPESKVTSLYGLSSGVAFRTTGLKPAKVRVYSRSTKKSGVIPVGGFRGDILLPTKLNGLHGKAISELYELLYGSLASGSDMDNLNRSLATLGMTGYTWPDFTQLLLANEYRRPFLSKAFAGLSKELERRLRIKALSLY